MITPPLLTNPENNKNIKKLCFNIDYKALKIGNQNSGYKRIFSRLCNKFYFRNLGITEDIEKSSQTFILPSPIFSIL